MFKKITLALGALGTTASLALAAVNPKIAEMQENAEALGVMWVSMSDIIIGAVIVVVGIALLKKFKII